MIKNLMFAIALIGAPVLSDVTSEAEETSVEVETTSETVEEETSSSEEVIEIDSVDDDDLEEVLEESSWVPDWFTPEAIAIAITGLTYLGTILKLFSSYKSLKISHNLTLKKIQSSLGEYLSENVDSKIKEVMDEYLPNLIEASEKQSEVLKGLSKVLALSQENTPESRVAILEVIENLGTIESSVIEEAKETVETAKKELEEKKEELKNGLDEIVTNNVEIM